MHDSLLINSVFTFREPPLGLDFTLVVMHSISETVTNNSVKGS